VFGNTFPAEKAAAFRAAGYGLAKFVIKAALTAEVLHYQLPNLGASPQLECWNTGMLEYWVLEKYKNGLLGKFPLT
jgi:hypothetical protein